MASSADRDVFEVCGRCGERLAGTDWYPATTRVRADGTRLVRSFCDGDCLAAWDGPE
ncbi:DUF7576 family protein [Halosimplex amylolyticum]|uniref:DUF7576 family protein n=1 Tax=Halosimplex amylolyticum TaxID=3396616 RepID=UPI003F56E609